MYFCFLSTIASQQTSLSASKDITLLGCNKSMNLKVPICFLSTANEAEFISDFVGVSSFSTNIICCITICAATQVTVGDRIVNCCYR